METKNSNVKLEETENRRRLHIGSFFVDLNESDFLELERIFGKTILLPVSSTKNKEMCLILGCKNETCRKGNSYCKDHYDCISPNPKSYEENETVEGLQKQVYDLKEKIYCAEEKNKKPDGYIYSGRFYYNLTGLTLHEPAKPVYFSPQVEKKLTDEEIKIIIKKEIHDIEDVSADVLKLCRDLYSKGVELGASLSPVPSNRIETKELRKKFINWYFDFDTETNPSMSQVFAFFCPHLSVSDEVKKPIEEITDEDAIEVAKIFGAKKPFLYERFENYIIVMDKNKSMNQFKVSIWFDSEINLTINEREIPISINVFKAYQYLQSKNYQLPKYY